MTETLLGLLEALAVLVPLTGIFIHQGFRLTQSYQAQGSSAEVAAARLALVCAGAAISVAGMLVAGAIVVTLSSVFVRVAGVMLYAGFLGFLAVLLVVWVAVHPEKRPSDDQATLAEARDRLEAERPTAPTGAARGSRVAPGTLLELFVFVLLESALAFTLAEVYVQTDTELAGVAALSVFGVAAAFVGYGFYVATKPELKAVFRPS